MSWPVPFLCRSGRPSPQVIGGGIGFLFNQFAHHLEKRLRLGAQGTMARVNDVKAAVQRFGVHEFYGAQLTATDLGRYGHQRKKRHPETALDHSLSSLDGIDFESDVGH